MGHVAFRWAALRGVGLSRECRDRQHEFQGGNQVSRATKRNGPFEDYYVSIFRFTELWESPSVAARGEPAVGVARAHTLKDAMDALLLEVARQGWVLPKGRLEVFPLDSDNAPRSAPGESKGIFETLLALAAQGRAVVCATAEWRKGRVAAPLH